LPDGRIYPLTRTRRPEKGLPDNKIIRYFSKAQKAAWAVQICELFSDNHRCDTPLHVSRTNPVYILADEKHSTCLADKFYLPTIVRGRVLWHLGYTTEASAVALTQSYGEFQCAALQQDPSYRVKGALTDGFDSTTKSMRTLFPGVRVGTCLRHALIKLPKK